MTQVFDGYALAKKRELQLAERVQTLKLSQPLQIAAILFEEDQGSRLYTRLKREAAERVGMVYQVFTFSLRDDVTLVTDQIQTLNQDQQVTGIIVQKPWRTTWLNLMGGNVTAEDFNTWWHTLTQAISETKDVDGLHPQTLIAIKAGTRQAEGKVLPATAKAVLEILKTVPTFTTNSSIVILGKSDILGQPLFYELKNLGYEVEMIGSKELTEKSNSGIFLKDKDVVISSTGHQHLITGDMVKEGVMVVDVGEPKPDVEFATVSSKASFITPVPGGVGPMTVISLLENAVEVV